MPRAKKQHQHLKLLAQKRKDGCNAIEEPVHNDSTNSSSSESEVEPQLLIDNDFDDPNLERHLQQMQFNEIFQQAEMAKRTLKYTGNSVRHKRAKRAALRKAASGTRLITSYFTPAERESDSELTNDGDEEFSDYALSDDEITADV